MTKIAPLIAIFTALALSSNPVLAKGKDQAKEKHQAQSRQAKGQAQSREMPQSESRWENTNKQSLEDSSRAQERAEQRHEMHQQEQYGQPRYTNENPVDGLIDRNVENLESGVRDFERRAVDEVSEGIRELNSPPQKRGHK